MPARARKKFLNWTRTQWTFPLTMEAGHYIMMYCKNREHRRHWYESYTATTRPEKDCDNRPVALSLARAYGEDAAIHDYEDFYAALLNDKMIKDPRVIEELLAKLLPILSKQYRKNYEKFSKSACAKHKLEKLCPWDFNYTVVRPSPGVPYGMVGELEEYFELGQVKKFLFAYLENIFELRFIPHSRDSNPENYWVYDCRKQKYLATVSFAPDASTQGKLVAGKATSEIPDPAAKSRLNKFSISCGFMGARAEGPTLLDLCDLRILFHEVGHTVEGVLTGAVCPELILERPEADTEEFYSMFLENLIFEPEFLHAMSSHYRTGKKISQAVLAPSLAREEFFDVLNTSRWWEVSMKEREIHRWPPNRELITQLAHVENSIYGQRRFLHPNLLYETLPGLFCTEPGDEQGLGNRHAYLLGRLLAQSVFKKFKNNKSLFRPGVGKNLRDEIYAQRPYRSFFDSYCAYTGVAEISLDLENFTKLRSRPAATRQR